MWNTVAFYSALELSAWLVELCELVSKLIELIYFVDFLSLESFAGSSYLFIQEFAFGSKFLKAIRISHILIGECYLDEAWFCLYGRDRFKWEFAISLDIMNITSFLSCSNLLFYLIERNPSTYLELNMEGSLTRSFKKKVRIRILFSMCLTVLLAAFLLGMGGMIWVG